VREDSLLHHQIRNLLSRPSTQPLFSRLLTLCHAALNYGGGQSVGSSGELDVLRFVRDASWRSNPCTVFDVGANDGEYLRAALDVLGDRTRVWCFEPHASSFRALQSSFAGHAGVQARNIALGLEPGAAHLHFEADGSTTASLAANAAGQGTEEVQVDTVDHVCRNEHIEHIDLLKIDTEGYEMDVLHGARQMMESGRIRSIQFEFGHTFLATPYHFSDLWELLAPQYVIHRILRHGMVEITHYSHDLEIYKIANFFCVQKSLSHHR